MVEANIIASITFSSAVNAESKLKVWNTYPMCRARKTSRRPSGRVTMSVSPTVIVPASGTETPAMRLRSVVLPEPLGPVRIVERPAGRAHSATLSASRSPPRPSGNDFCTPRRATAKDADVMECPSSRNAVGEASRRTPRPRPRRYRMAMGLTGTPTPPRNSSGPSTNRNSYARSLASSSRLRISMMYAPRFQTKSRCIGNARKPKAFRV